MLYRFIIDPVILRASTLVTLIDTVLFLELRDLGALLAYGDCTTTQSATDPDLLFFRSSSLGLVLNLCIAFILQIYTVNFDRDLICVLLLRIVQACAGAWFLLRIV